MTRDARSSAWFLILAPGIIWGASFLFIAEGLEAVGPTGVTLLRVLIGFVTLSLVPAAWKPIPRADWGRVALLGIVWLTFPLSMFPFAEQRVSSALTGMLNGATPLFAAIVASVLARRLPGRPIMIGLGIGMLGGVLMALPSVGEGRSSALGIGMIVAALVSYGFALNIARPLQQRHGALPVIRAAQGVALVFLAPLGFDAVRHAHWSPVPVVSLLALGALGTGLAFVMTTAAAGRIGATRAASTAFIMPPVALVLGVVLRHEHVAPLAILGGAACLLGAWIMNRAQRAALAPPAAAPVSPMPAVSRP